MVASWDVGMGARAGLRVAIGTGLSRGLSRGHGGASLQRVAGKSPAERGGAVAIPRGDELLYRRPQCRRGGKAAVAQALTLKNAEEQLHLIDPRRVLGRVVEEEALIVPGVEGAPPLRVTVEVDVQIVPDHVHRARRILGGDVFHRSEER